jgi:hypothetical protein
VSIGHIVDAGVHTFEQLFGLWLLNGCTANGVEQALLAKEVRGKEAKEIATAVHQKLYKQSW